MMSFSKKYSYPCLNHHVDREISEQTHIFAQHFNACWLLARTTCVAGLSARPALTFGLPVAMTTKSKCGTYGPTSLLYRPLIPVSQWILCWYFLRDQSWPPHVKHHCCLFWLLPAGNQLKLWDLLSGGKLLCSVSNHQKAITCLSLDSEGSRLISGSSNVTSHLWPTKGGLDHHVKIYSTKDYSVTHSMTYILRRSSAWHCQEPSLLEIWCRL